MKTPPILIAGATLIGITIGFIAGSSREERGAIARDDTPAVSSRMMSNRRADERRAGSADVVSGIIKGRDFSTMSAADALVLVKANTDYFLGGGDPVEMARKNYEYQLMLSKLPLAELEQLITLSQDSGVKYYLARQMFGVYAARNLNKAMAWAATQPNADSWKESAVGALAAHDPERAMKLHQDIILNGGGMNGGYELANSFAKQGKTALLEFIDSLPSSGAGNIVSLSMRSLPKEDLPGFLAELENRVKEGKIDQWAINSAMQNLSASDPELARSLIDKMDVGPERAKRELAFADALSRQGKAAEALDLLKSAMAQHAGKEKEFLLNEASMYGGRNLASQIAEALPAGMEWTVDDVKKLSGSGQWQGQDVVNMAKFLKTPEDQSLYLVEAIQNLGNRRSKLNETDFRVLEHRLQSLGFTGDNAAIVQQALAASRKKALGK